jgi:putative hemolysin
MKLSFAAAAVVAVIATGCAGNLTSPQSSAIGGTSGIDSARTASASTLHQPASQQLSPAAAARIQVPKSVAPDLAQSAAYCRQTGGQIEMRTALYGTNGSSPLQLAGIKYFCQYTANTSGGSRIHILLSTLYATKPSLAALAYILAPKITGSCEGNPASCYCSQLGGSDQFGGTTGAGGGWYKKNSIDQVLEACIFPDMSSIDSWGLAYHSDGVIRGIDLTTVMRYKYTGDAIPRR